MMSITSTIINKVIFIIVMSCILTSCSSKVNEFNALCHTGWNEQYPLSNAVYNMLSKEEFTSYISIKKGNDRGAYSFSFLGKSSESVLFLHANKEEIITIPLEIHDFNKAYAIITQNEEKLTGYTGSGDVWSHLNCGYMKIKAPKIAKTLSFHDYSLKASLQEPVSHMGVAAFERVSIIFNDYLSQSLAEGKVPNVYVTKANTIPCQGVAISTMETRMKIYPFFYEIP